MRQIIAYNLVEADDLDTFLAAMSQCIEDGWEPLGGLVTSPDFFRETGGDICCSYVYGQAIVRYKDGPWLN